MTKKIVLSRKGFDSANGGMPSPILPDGTLLSLPIPFDKETLKYSDLFHGDKSYQEIIHELNPTFKDEKCHLDPDLYPIILEERDENWNACFGQSHAAQTHLENNEVSIGDIFLFFGWFKQTEYVGTELRFVKGARNQHIIFGYLEIGEKCVERSDIEVYKWHPHAFGPSSKNIPNAIYVAAKNLSGTDLPGYGTFKISGDLILTKDGMTRSKWNLPKVLENKPITYHSDSSHKDNYFQSAMIGQEFVIPSDQSIDTWVQNIVKNCRNND